MKDREGAELLRIGELADAVGKSVRAIHLYEELGLLAPSSRTSGGFRLFDRAAIDRVRWIGKLQAIGFSLPDIQGFVREFEASRTGVAAARRVRDVFGEKLREVRRSIAQLEAAEQDLGDALAYLEGCHGCVASYKPDDCRACDHDGHELGDAPELFLELSKVALPPRGDRRDERRRDR
jgi:DNA-binding transcriptional MerR regulator